MWPFRRRKQIARGIANEWDLQSTLFLLSPTDPFRLADAFEGVAILGATGSGKSTGSGRAIAMSFLEAGFGGIVLTAKNDELSSWESYCKQAGRIDDLIVFSSTGQHRFSFLDYEHKRAGSGAGLTENIVNLFSEVLQIADRQSGQGGREDEGYWRRAMRQLCRNLVDLMVLSKGSISVPGLYRLTVSAPTSDEQVRSDTWRAESFCYQCLKEAEARTMTASQRGDFEIVADYFLLEYPALSEKTRSVIVSTFTSMVDILNRGLLRELFCTTTTLTPERVMDGKILVIDLPVKEFREVGAFAQILWKAAFQQCVERRNVAENPRPVFLWIDEAQNYITAGDQQFQSTARSARVATVYLTQNLSNVYAALGENEQGHAQADSLLGNLNTKILHANADPVTNQWASEIIGRTRQYFVNASNNYSNLDPFSALMGGNDTTQAGVNESMEFEVEPSTFMRLSRGGPSQNYEVEGILVQGGRCFRATGRPWLPVTFRQRP